MPIRSIRALPRCVLGRQGPSVSCCRKAGLDGPISAAPRRGVQPDQPSTAASEQPFQDSAAPNRETCEDYPDEVAEMLSGLVPPDRVTRAEIPRHGRARGSRALRHPSDRPSKPMTAEERLLILDTWQRSELPAGDFAALIGMSKHTLYD